MKYKTKGDSSPQGKPRVYFTGHPADVRQHFESITDAILKFHNCAIFYDEDRSVKGSDLLPDIKVQQLFGIGPSDFPVKCFVYVGTF